MKNVRGVSAYYRYRSFLFFKKKRNAAHSILFYNENQCVFIKRILQPLICTQRGAYTFFEMYSKCKVIYRFRFRLDLVGWSDGRSRIDVVPYKIQRGNFAFYLLIDSPLSIPF